MEALWKLSMIGMGELEILRMAFNPLSIGKKNCTVCVLKRKLSIIFTNILNFYENDTKRYETC